MTRECFTYWNRREKPRHNDIVLTREAPMEKPACTTGH